MIWDNSTPRIAALVSVVLASITGQVEAQPLAGWYDFGTGNNNFESSPGKAPDINAAGITGEVFSGSGSRGEMSSTDGTFGPSLISGAGDSAGTSGTANGAMAIRTLSGQEDLFVTITNGSATAITLDSLVFDYSAIQGTSGFTAIDRITLSYASGDLDDTDGSVIGFIDGVDSPPLAFPVVDDYRDAEFSLGSVLTDVILDSAESATFRILGQDLNNTSGESSGVAVAIDNIAITAAAVPEPASIAIWSILGIGLAGFGYYRVRRKR